VNDNVSVYVIKYYRCVIIWNGRE